MITSIDEETALLVERLIEWHDVRVEALQKVLDNCKEGTQLQLGDSAEPITLNKDVARGIRAGIQIALSQLGKLPIELEMPNEEENSDE